MAFDNLEVYEIGDIVFALNRDEMSGSLFRVSTNDDTGALGVWMSKESAYALLQYYRKWTRHDCGPRDALDMD